MNKCVIILRNRIFFQNISLVLDNFILQLQHFQIVLMNGILTWNRGLYNIAVLLDLKKAFDTVNHEILLCKFERYGFDYKALDLLKNYLTDRTQRCQLNGMLSDQRRMTCGIPQGSILGPLLFIIYINDSPNCLKHTTPRMFADDTSLTAVGKTFNEAEEIANKDLKNVKA